MCAKSNLYSSSHGLVTYCSDCNEFQILFGTTGLQLNPIEFKAFYDYIRYFEPETDQGKHVKCNRIPIPNQSTFVVLTSPEFDRLKIIMECSMASLHIDGILDELHILRSE
jgi:hypothetical protein